jgi:hypothetical protein
MDSALLPVLHNIIHKTSELFKITIDKAENKGIQPVD